jgi:hypothetical protein
VASKYGDGVYIRACWGSREESPAELADRFVRLIDRLSSIDPVFALWTSGAKGPKKFETIRDNYADVVKACMSRDDFGEPVPIEGYAFFAITRGQPHSRSFSVGARAGAYMPTSSYQNSLDFETSDMDVPDPSSVSYPLFRSVMSAIIDIWSPDDCLVMPQQLMGLIDLDRHFRDPWMQYLSKPFADLITPPSDVHVERFSDGGLLMVATTDTFNVDNPAHLAGARAIGAATLPLEKLPYVKDPNFP